MQAERASLASRHVPLGDRDQACAKKEEKEEAVEKKAEEATKKRMQELLISSKLALAWRD